MTAFETYKDMLAASRRRWLNLPGGSEAGSDGSLSSEGAAASSEPEAEALRRDVLTGHLLALATEDGLPRHALPALATSLQVGIQRFIRLAEFIHYDPFATQKIAAGLFRAQAQKQPLCDSAQQCAVQLCCCWPLPRSLLWHRDIDSDV